MLEIYANTYMIATRTDLVKVRDVRPERRSRPIWGRLFNNPDRRLDLKDI